MIPDEISVYVLSIAAAAIAVIAVLATRNRHRKRVVFVFKGEKIRPLVPIDRRSALRYELPDDIHATFLGEGTRRPVKILNCNENATGIGIEMESPPRNQEGIVIEFQGSIYNAKTLHVKEIGMSGKYYVGLEVTPPMKELRDFIHAGVGC